jgi:hypothetical protein
MPNVTASLRTDMFQSCDDLSDISMQATRQGRQDAVERQRLVALSLRASLSEIKHMQLPEGADEVSKRLAHDLEHLEAIIAGRDTSKFTSQTSLEAAGDSSASTEGRASKPSWKKVISKAQKQAEDSMREGAMAPALNRLIKILWPRIDKYVEDMLTKSIEPSINASLPGAMRGSVKFTEVSLGDTSPMLGPLWVEYNDNKAIEFHMGINIQSDMDVEMTVMSLKVGISHFSLKGKMVILMDPPMEKPPFFGGLQVYFPNPPEINLNFVGAARVADVPMLRGAVRGAIDSAVAGACVLPRRIAVDMNEDDEVDLIDLTYPEPIGILRLTLWSGNSLIASDRSIWGAATSDPYVVASLGIKNWHSPTIKKTLNPEWGSPEEGLTFDLPVHDDCQEVSLKVYDYDFASADDLIGIARQVEVQTLILKKEKQTLPLMKENGEEGAGSLTISASFLNLVTTKPTAPLKIKGPSQAHLSVKVFTITGLESGSEYPFKVRIQVIMPDSDSSHNSFDSTRTEPSPEPSLSKEIAKKNVKKSKSMEPSGTQGKVLVEETTSASQPKQQKELAEALRGVALHLSDKINDTKEIAEILDVGETQVQQFLERHDGKDKKTIKAQEEAMKQRMSVQNPRLDEVVQMLLPVGACDPLSVVELAVIDKRQKILGTAKINMPQLLNAKDLQCEGPFQCDVAGVEVVAKAQLRWLA